LVSQFLFDLRVDLFDGEFLFHFEELASGFLGDSLENLLPVRAVLQGITTSATATPAAVAAMASITSSAAVAVSILVRK
jgi:hypothetical protein